MKINLTPYLSFKDNTRQALEFYHTVFGSKLVTNTFKEYQVSQDQAKATRLCMGCWKQRMGLLFWLLILQMACGVPAWGEHEHVAQQ
jgi:hypothetical protein